MTSSPTNALRGRVVVCLLVAAVTACAKSESMFEAEPSPSAGEGPATDASTAPNGSDPTLGGTGGSASDARAPSQYPSHVDPPPRGTVVAGSVPANAESLFRAAKVDPSAEPPSLVYPTPETMFPPNMPDILFQWRGTPGHVFRIQFVEGKNTLDVYTDGRNPTCEQAATGGSCWESASTDLMLYFGDAADIRSDVKFTIASLSPAQPGKMAVSPTYALHVARTDITGAVYYWSTTAKGIRRGNFGGPASTDGGAPKRPAPVDYLTKRAYPPTTEADDARCAACHTLSRDGKKLAVSLNGDVLGIVDVVSTIPPPMTFGPPSKGFSGAYIGASWSTFSPDTRRIVTASTGVMTLRETTSGQPVGGTGVIALPDKVAGSMPDWSPDGQRLVFASTPISPPNSSYGRHLYGSSIAMLTTRGDTFAGYELVATSTQTNCKPTLDGGAPNPAFAPGARETYANPMFSNDNKWLVFSRAECESENDPTAEVVLAPATPKAPQNRLLRANRQVGSAQVTNVTNGMPVWGPTNDPHIAWIAFTSTRDYGLVLTPGSKIGSTMSPPFPSSGVRQLWIAAVDLSKVTPENVASIDPSYPAFRFSAQDLTENNHRPFWTVDTIPEVNEIPPIK